MNEPVSTNRFRWAVWLPLIAVGVTTALLFYVPLQDEAFFHANPGSRGYLAVHVAPAWSLAALINGPSFLIGGVIRFPYPRPFDEFGRILTVLVFWLIVGIAIDRRNRGLSTPSFRSPVSDLVFRCLMFGGTAVLLAGMIAVCANRWDFRNLDDSWKLWGLRSPVVAIAGNLLWSLALTIYFGKRSAKLALSISRRKL